jgi:hypothetical protein
VTDFEGILRRLLTYEVEFLLAGGVAATVHGSTRLTQDIDVVYSRSSANLERIVGALADQDPYPRGAPPGLPFEWSVKTLDMGLNFTLTTRLGDVDLLGEITGGGSYEDLVRHSVTIELFGMSCRCLDLETLIEVKRAAGRPKDFEAIAELEAIREERERGA